jgi:hypothetical protein
MPHTPDSTAPAKRPINGVRRLLEINDVRPIQRDRDQVALPDRAIAVD